MADKYILGVDGGNTKTDYLLCKADGTFVDLLRAGTCSHEANEGSFDWMQATMQAHMDTLCNRNGIGMADIVAAGFGLAGADMPWQVAELERRVRAIGFTKIGLQNDGILGVKAISASGVCAVNGTGTVIVGIDDQGKFMQVGGIGGMSGDAAGGPHIAAQAVTQAYHSLFRGGQLTKLVAGVFDVLGLKEPQDLHECINNYNWRSANTRGLIQMADQLAQAGDPTAQRIFENVGSNCAEGVVGCVGHLSFRDEIVVVKAGTIWNVIGYTGMVDSFTRTIRENVALSTRFELLECTPSLGALFWAKELLDGAVTQTYRDQMRSFLSPEKYAELAEKQ